MAEDAPTQPALIDEQLRELRTRVAAVRGLADRANDALAELDAIMRKRDSVDVQVLYEMVTRLADVSAADALADAVADLDASLLAGNALPSEWRDPSSASPVDRLTWICQRVWSRLSGTRATVQVNVDQPPTLFTSVGSLMDAPTTRWLAVCDVAPMACVGESAVEALRWLASYGAAEVAKRHGADDPAIAETAARVAELGLSLVSATAGVVLSLP